MSRAGLLHVVSGAGTGARKVMLGSNLSDRCPVDFFLVGRAGLRARFQWTAVVQEKLARYLDMLSRVRKKSMGQAVRFGATPPSPLLETFSLGRTRFLESRSGPTQRRVIATKGKAEMGRYALEATAQILQYYNDYLACLPLPKLDQIAAARRF